jgi:serine protease inhibitor
MDVKPDSAIRELSGSDDLAAVVQGNTEFALDLYGQLAGTEGNLFFSPYSILTALAMTYAGARANTEAQMARTLHFSPDPERLHPTFAALEAQLDAAQESGAVRLSVANALWPQAGYDLLPDYLALTKAYYGAAIFPVDYRQTEAARKRINAWVEQETENKIVDLIGPGILNALTRLVLVNAIYFKGNWASQFDEALTEEAPFWVTPGNGVPVPLMTRKATFGYTETESLQILELPYVGKSLSMIVLLPRQVDGLSELERALTWENLATWTSRLWQREVQVFLPRFRLTCDFELSEALKALGMIDAFGEADFSGMDGSLELYIRAVIHQAFVDVNEEGTEAAAATAVVMVTMSLQPSPPVFRANHPFLFFIRENRTSSILFFGRMVHPETMEG